ncbi:MAG TPA: aldo/keto reductase [Tahibacter sp.]|uniref:aldo/keto reductase family protein n=1 Tax=Tahibacter sp. TaxID=2056211 RepID=UPI002D1A168F|nr:aldo/keto reductase [Tahibacter sp.]HSX60911.1 aldo/keto reductase [Tahibacter sp.]
MTTAAAPDPRHRLTRDGVRMPRLLYGTAWKKERTAHWVEAALRAGFDGIDTACQPRHYDEAGAGAGVVASQRPRETLYLQTKFTPLSGQDPARLPYDPQAPLAAQVAQSFAVSQRHLATPRIDALLLHSPLRDRTGLRTVWQAMEALADAGSVSLIGISNCYDPAQLDALWRDARIKPAIVQNRFYADTGYDRDIRAFCRANDLVYQSFWTLSANPQLLSSATVLALAAAYERTPPQILFRYLVQRDVVPLTGTTSLRHLRDGLDVLGFALEERDARAIDALL